MDLGSRGTLGGEARSEEERPGGEGRAMLEEPR